jgi:hypothetical protein
VIGPSRARFRGWAVLMAVGFAAMLATDPVQHHGLDCHLKTPTHCHACLTHPLASKVEDRFSAGGLRPLPASAVVPPRQGRPRLVVVSSRSTRAPPA